MTSVTPALPIPYPIAMSPVQKSILCPSPLPALPCAAWVCSVFWVMLGNSSCIRLEFPGQVFMDLFNGTTMFYNYVCIPVLLKKALCFLNRYWVPGGQPHSIISHCSKSSLLISNCWFRICHLVYKVGPVCSLLNHVTFFSTLTLHCLFHLFHYCDILVQCFALQSFFIYKILHNFVSLAILWLCYCSLFQTTYEQDSLQPRCLWGLIHN